MLFLGVLAVTESQAQTLPNFSGDWVLVSPVRAPGAVPRELLIDHRAESQPTPELQVTSRWEEREDHDVFHIGIISGTVAGVGRDSAGGLTKADTSVMRTTTTIFWEGTRLVILKENFVGPRNEYGAYKTRRESWQMQPEGTLALTVSERSATDQPVVFTAIYRRR